MWPFRRRLTANEVGGQWASGRRLLKVSWQHESLRGLPGGLPAPQVEQHLAVLEERVHRLEQNARRLQEGLEKAGIMHWQEEGFRPGPRRPADFEANAMEDGSAECETAG